VRQDSTRSLTWPARLRTFVDSYGLADRKAILPGLQRCRPDQREQLRWLHGTVADLARAL
jgi:hypothetical protein